ncbi:response regulator [Actinokineospora sp. NBRC 105648]|uniref:response regulator n=1 Tax=Actinokineospora sp. NBRC 105648 TaxID=3032206 RepID=UPI0025549EE3|nr:response regulator [Actinokineospora sp. NBRC 105648]
MDTGWAVAIVGVLALMVGGVLVWRSQSRGDKVSAGLSLAELFSVELQITPGDKTGARDAVQAADIARGVSGQDAEGLIDADRTALARVLWVDDNPGNNRYEVLALERLGKLVFQVVDSSCAHFYLENLSFDVVVTDIARHDDPAAGMHMIRELRGAGFGKPIVVYTSKAGAWADEALNAGADAVVDLPGDLVRAVVEFSR